MNLSFPCRRESISFKAPPHGSLSPLPDRGRGQALRGGALKKREDDAP